MPLTGDACGNFGRYLAQVSSPPPRPSAGPPGRTGRPTGQRGRIQGRRNGTPPPTVVTGSRRGLTVLGAAILVVLAGTAGAAVDLLFSDSPGITFGILFVAGCILAATRVHSDDLIGIVIMPPLVYALIVVGIGFVHPSSGSGTGGLRSKTIDIASNLILRAPILLIGFATVALIAAIRARRAQVTRRERERAHTLPENRRTPGR
ncbi:DUF6542 domain-containing protein [Frankia sp. Cppng1_Ct_nod]|uniref:DUF6542 domain-containing protein n=1 Tax=Frankia sp. Cppng1_Ct_nod TaxID=2897162 RepID=UPI001F5F9B33